MKQLCILVIEPDKLQQLGIRSALSASGYRCAAAESADGAAELLREHFRLVFIGPSFSEMQAQLIADTVRSALVTPAAIVALTALPDCMIGIDMSGTGAKTPPDLPAALEALTRFIRFAPPQKACDMTKMDRLLDDWAAYTATNMD